MENYKTNTFYLFFTYFHFLINVAEILSELFWSFSSKNYEIKINYSKIQFESIL